MIFVQFWSAEDKYIQDAYMHVLPKAGEGLRLVEDVKIYKVIYVSHFVYTDERRHVARVYLKETES